ncbi:MAG TPA: GntR family transcriptional regulator [Euzebyales bacterium]|nr:GntR family transcriptional regulator [Euzebyales bacterium]
MATKLDLSTIKVAQKDSATAHEFVRETLRGAILRGDIEGGARLVQADIAYWLQVSTTPVREALRDLATEGLIVLHNHRGGTVRELDWEQMQEILLIRQQIERLAVTLGIERITETELGRAEMLCELMANEPDLGKWVDLNRRFHGVLHEAMRSPQLTDIIKRLEESAAIFIAQAQRQHPEIRRRANRDHLALLDAYRRRDAEAALEIQSTHLTLPIAGPGGDGAPR